MSCRRRRRRALVVLVLGCSSAGFAASGCGGRTDQLAESRRLETEGRAMRDAGFRDGDQEKFERGQTMIDRAARMRADALDGV